MTWHDDVAVWNFLNGVVDVNTGDQFIITTNQDVPRVFWKKIDNQFDTPS